ncbi:MAG: beta-ketoacyl-[acyl-carrier-protein] synthase family protein [Pseudomonadota bacterium]
MDKRRVVITGLGAINAAANDVEEYATALMEGRCGIGPLTVFDPAGHMTATAAEVKNLDPPRMVPAGFPLRRMSRADVLGAIAASQALESSGLLPLRPETARDMGVVVGGGAGGLLEAEDFYRDYLARPGRGARFSRLAMAYCASTADHLTSHYGLYGPKATFMTACSAGGTALGFARDLIQDGLAQTVLAGGVEPLCRMTYTAFNSLRAVDPDYCKPFDKNRAGLTLGEGSAFMVMESLEHARARGAGIIAEFLGYGLSADAHHMTAPDPEGRGAALAIKAALMDAGLALEQIDYINAHGTATPANDPAETKAIKAVFGPRAYRIPVSSTKSMIGHTLGAAGSLEAAAVILALGRSFIPPTVNHNEPDPACDLDYVPRRARFQEINIALSNSLAFGGNNTAVILARFTEKGMQHE